MELANGLEPGKANVGGRLGTADLLIKVACFVKNINYIFFEKELI
jgi:hypothetical protein